LQRLNTAVVHAQSDNFEQGIGHRKFWILDLGFWSG
jgi:hypothetical protein